MHTTTRTLLFATMALTLFCSSACKNGIKHINDPTVYPLEDFEKTPPINLISEPMKNDSIIWSGRLMHYIDNHLIMQCWECNSNYWIYEIAGDSLRETGKFLDKGGGPYEMMHSNSCFNGHNRKIYFYHTSNNITGYVVPVASIQSFFLHQEWEKLSVPTPPKCLYGALTPLNDTLFAVLGGCYEEKEIELVTLVSAGGYHKGLGIPLPDDGNDASMFTKSCVYRDQGSLLYNKSKNKLYYGAGGGGFYAGIITLDDNYNAVDEKVFLNEFPAYRTWTDGMNFVYTRHRRIEPYATDCLIYMLPSPNRQAYDRQYKGFNDVYNDEVYVFDWDGNFVRRYRLDIPILMFVVDDREEYLYGTTKNPEDDEYKIVRFKLKD